MILPLKYYLPKIMTDKNTKALLLLRDGFKDEFWRYVANNERFDQLMACLLYTSPSPRDYAASRMPSSA